MITVLIRCSDDYRVLECINSIKRTSFSTPVIVSMTPNRKLKNKIGKLKITTCIVPKHNAALTNNIGLSLVKTKKVIITDSDTVFEKNTIKHLENGLNKYDVVKPRLIFLKDVNQFFSALIADLRTFFNDNNDKMYIPGLAFNLNIKSKIGGYYFDKRIPWGEDSEFSDRVTTSNLKLKHIKKAVLYHPSIEIKHDLSDAFLIGLKKTSNKDNIYAFLDKRINFYKKLLNLFGAKTFLYGLLWYSFFDLGKLFKNFRKVQKRVEMIAWDILSNKFNN